jgi:hypothetical protein
MGEEASKVIEGEIRVPKASIGWVGRASLEGERGSFGDRPFFFFRSSLSRNLRRVLFFVLYQRVRDEHHRSFVDLYLP